MEYLLFCFNKCCSSHAVAVEGLALRLGCPHTVPRVSRPGWLLAPPRKAIARMQNVCTYRTYGVRSDWPRGQYRITFLPCARCRLRAWAHEAPLLKPLLLPYYCLCLTLPLADGGPGVRRAALLPHKPHLHRRTGRVCRLLRVRAGGHAQILGKPEINTAGSIKDSRIWQIVIAEFKDSTVHLWSCLPACRSVGTLIIMCISVGTGM